MNVELYEYTGSGRQNPADYAAGILIFTKQTRLQMTPGLLAETMAMPYEDKLKELEYMANTIPSSWEMCDYHFLISGVTRAYTHQQVRTRNASFAQQTMRVLDVSEGRGWEYLTGPSIKGAESENKEASDEFLYGATMDVIDATYKALIKNGVKIEDARGILPTNILTNIVMKINMRAFVELVRKRSSPRVQGEYRDVLAAMQDAVKAVHPWISLFIDRTFERAAKDLDAEIATMADREQATRMLKLVDILRAQS